MVNNQFMDKEKSVALKRLGEKIKELRQQRGIAGHELSRMLGKEVSYITTVEQGKLNIGWWTLLELCECLGISMQELVGHVLK